MKYWKVTLKEGGHEAFLTFNDDVSGKSLIEVARRLFNMHRPSIMELSEIGKSEEEKYHEK